jgi:hypothetical protein
MPFLLSFLGVGFGFGGNDLLNLFDHALRIQAGRHGNLDFIP